MNKYFNIILFGLVFEGDFLIECKFVGGRGGDLVGERIASKFEIDFAGEFDFKGEVEYVKCVGIDFYLSLDRHC